MDTNAVVATTNEEATPLLEKIQTMGVEYGVKILGALVNLVIGMWIAKMIKEMNCIIQTKFNTKCMK